MANKIIAVNRKELIKALSVTKKHRGENPFVTIAAKSRSAELVAYSGERPTTDIILPINGGGSETQVTFVTKDLETYVKALKSEVAQFEFDEDGDKDVEVAIYGGGRAFSIAGLNTKSAIQDGELSDATLSVKMTKTKWEDAIRKVAFAADGVRQSRNLVHLEVENKDKVIFVATNGYVLATYGLIANIEGAKKSADILQSHIAALLHKLKRLGPSAGVELRANEYRYEFRYGEERLLAGAFSQNSFPKTWRKVGVCDRPGVSQAMLQVKFDREELLQKVEDLILLGKVENWDTDCVLIYQKAGTIFVSGKDKAYAMRAENAEYRGTIPFRWAASAEKIADILWSIDSKYVTIEQQVSGKRFALDDFPREDYSSPLIFTNDLAWKVLLMPMRITK